MATKYRKHYCINCGVCVDNMTRLQQDQHEKKCKPQQKLDLWDFDKSII